MVSKRAVRLAHAEKTTLKATKIALLRKLKKRERFEHTMHIAVYLVDTAPVY